MKLKLIPKEITFFDLFKESAKCINEGANVLLDLVGTDDYEEKVELAFKLSEIEHKADESTHTILKKVFSTFVTPFDRDYIYNLAHRMDDIVDLLDDVSEIVSLYKIDKLPAKTKKFVKLLVDASELCLEYIPKLDSPSKLSDFWIEINSIENECDKLFRTAISNLFEEEIDAIKVIKIKDFLETLEQCADAFEALASVVETIAIEES
jgi:predicted phosphate transport protein (TIGR00153 family)